MKEKELAFDRKKHMLYSKTAKNVILKHLSAAYGTEASEELWEKIQKTYVDFLKDMPFIGGRKNTQAGGVYDSIALFAYYEAVPIKPDFEEMSMMNRETFVPAMQAIGFLDMNRLSHAGGDARRAHPKKHLCAWQRL
ncbi:MAG: hypothetical protein NC123_20625 [Butyrivibrio sp.]|nr:hypothetical protein [Butyrivibrio sp.]